MKESVTCYECDMEVEVECFPSDPGNPDIESPTCCPPTEAWQEPTHCPDCGEELEQLDADQMEIDAKESADEARFDEWRDEQRGQGE